MRTSGKTISTINECVWAKDLIPRRATVIVPCAVRSSYRLPPSSVSVAGASWRCNVINGKWVIGADDRDGREVRTEGVCSRIEGENQEWLLLCLVLDCFRRLSSNHDSLAASVSNRVLAFGLILALHGLWMFLWPYFTFLYMCLFLWKNEWIVSAAFLQITSRVNAGLSGVILTHL